MFHGLLELSGTIDLAQFWPGGESDADTAKVLISGANAFRFRANASAPFKVTHAFDGAIVKGKGSKPPIDKNNRVTIRLQGIDATELHYRPVIPTLNKKKPTDAQRTRFNAVNGNFRQFFGETSAMKLHQFLSKAGASPVQCIVRTSVDEPSDVFDMFGRMVGDIIVKIGAKEQNVNNWLCANGWAFPTFYSSMSNQEITEITKLSEKARKSKIGIWKKSTSKLSFFDPKMVFRSHGTPDPAKDAGPQFMPKLFRRRSTFAVARLSGLVTGSLKPYLQAEPDDCFETVDFLNQGSNAATVRHLDEFVTTGSQFTVGPKDLVFREGHASVIGKNGKPAHW